MDNKILYYAEIINSKMDVNGNRYFSLLITRTSDGKTAKGKISGGESNCTYAMRQLCGESWDNFRYTRVELPIRDYNRLVKNWQYLGCTAEEIIKNANEQFDK
jgi:hypothetical protein